MCTCVSVSVSVSVLESTFVYAYLQVDYTVISNQYWNYLYHMNTYGFSTEPTQLYYRAMNTYESLLAYTIVRNSLRTIGLAK